MIEETHILGEGLGKMSETTRLTQSICSQKCPSVVDGHTPNGLELSGPATLCHPIFAPRAGSALEDTAFFAVQRVVGRHQSACFSSSCLIKPSLQGQLQIL